ncbi:DUF742 domain-containing protein [Streptomyces cucumeris]|uniref:DUF742 domain-containing protein n=1 Tax=Streptomyces cucumeris TaxID=2962890 RepID=UPI003D7149D0
MVAGEPAPHEAEKTGPAHPPPDGPEGAADRVSDPADRATDPVGPVTDPVGRASAIRPFLLTAGRVAGRGSAAPLPVETQIVATPDGLTALPSLTFERHAIVAACRRPQSVAELAARLRLHLNVVRVLAEDLCAAGQLAVHVPNARAAQDISVLRRVIDGLRAVPDSRGTLRDSG